MCKVGTAAAMNTVTDAVAELTRIFRRAPHKRAAHAESRELLRQIAGEPRFTTDALRRYVGRREYLERGNYPVVSVPIASNPYFDLIINCWIPLPDRRTDLSTKAIHHHGPLLLSTASIFGPGYEHWLFTRPRPLPGSTTTYGMDLLEAARHGLGHVAFVDACVPHLPVYPPDLSLTLALWSDSKPTTALHHLKRMSLFRGREAQLRAMAVRLGLRRALALKVVEGFDFHPVAGGFEVIPDRREFPLGPNEDHLQSLLHVLQRTGNEHLAPEIGRHASERPFSGQPVLDDLLGDVRAGRPVEGKLSPGHYTVPYANFSTAEILGSLRELAQRPPETRERYAC
jgi:hypothetical protein